MKNNRIKILIIVGWIVLIFIGILIFRRDRVIILEEEILDYIVDFQDINQYNFSVNTNLQGVYSPLYTCEANIVPDYIDNLVEEIDTNLERIEDRRHIRWTDGDRDVLVYDIDTTVLNINLFDYDKNIRFNSIDTFVSKFLNSNIEYYEIEEQISDNTKIYLANRKIGEVELKTSSSYSDYYHIENGYLLNARILLAQISQTKYSVPLIQDREILERYLANNKYPKRIALDTTSLIQVDEQTYENSEIDLEYDSCLINSLLATPFFSSCNNNYIYYVYYISGICDVVYENGIYTVPFNGFINGVDPRYVKTFY